MHNDPVDPFVFWCTQCPYTPSLIMPWQEISFVVNNHWIFLDLRRQTTQVLTSAMNSVLELNYLADITPATAQTWLERILNLKAFL